MGDTLKFQGWKIKVLNLGMKVEYVLYFKDEKKIIFKYIFIKGKLHFRQELVIKFMEKVSI